jgi:hypothetical protein
MRDRIFPYPTLEGDVRLRLFDGGVDDGGWPRAPYTEDRRLVELYDLDKEKWKRTDFKVEVMLPAEEVAGLDSKGVGVTALVVIECSRTQYRQTVALCKNPVEPYRWGGVVEMERGNFTGKVVVQAVVVGLIHASANRFLGHSEQWVIYLDEPDISPLSGAIRVKWVDFDEPGDGDYKFLQEFREQSFYTDLQSNTPTLFLNKSKRFDGLPALLDDRKRDPAGEALHNAERVGIARSVWMAMFNASIASISPDEDGTPDWPTEDWKRRVLQILLARFYPELGDTERLDEAWRSWKSPDRAGELESRVQAEINLMMAAPKLLRRTLEFISRASTAEGSREGGQEQ